MHTDAVPTQTLHHSLLLLQQACTHWPGGADNHQSLLAFTKFHGLQPLLGQALAARQTLPDTWQRSPWRETTTALIRAWHRERSRELFRHQALQHLRTILDDHQIPGLFLKGTALAHSYYRYPAQRPRCDADLLVAAGSEQRVMALLEDHGYQRSAQEPQGTRLSYQASLHRYDEHSIPQTVDLHWRISNRQSFATALDHAALWAYAEPIPTLGAGAWMPCRNHLLLHAALHRAAHLREHVHIAGLEQCVGNRLLWLYDIHLLCSGLSQQDWHCLCDEAIQRGLAAVLADALCACQHAFNTTLPRSSLAKLQAITGEPAAAYLRTSRLQHLVADFRALDWRGRGQLAQEILFPPAQQLRRSPDNTAPIAWLYLRRLWQGTRRLLLGRS